MRVASSASQNKIEIIKPDWPAAKNIQAFCTTRNAPQNNFSAQIGAYDYFNLAQHVADNAASVEANRQQLKTQFNLPSHPVWLDQVHGKQVADITKENTPIADAAFSHQKNKVCTVLTADCLPVLICNKKGNKVAAAHAGWRGLAGGVIEATVNALDEKKSELLVWLGPAIGPNAFEVGAEVRDVFVKHLPQTRAAFQQNREQHYLADIYQLARLRLNALGVEAIYGGEYCTFTDANRFYSFRRDGTTGRQASLIWFE